MNGEIPAELAEQIRGACGSFVGGLADLKSLRDIETVVEAAICHFHIERISPQATRHIKVQASRRQDTIFIEPVNAFTAFLLIGKCSHGAIGTEAYSATNTSGLEVTYADGYMHMSSPLLPYPPELPRRLVLDIDFGKRQLKINFED